MNKGKTFNETNLFTPIKLETHPLLEGIETTLNIGGVVCPFSALLGLGVGLYNKKYATKNLQIIVDKLNQVSRDLVITEQLVIENERNLTFNIQKILNAVIKERQEEKLEYYKNIIINWIVNRKIFDCEDDTIDIVTDILSNLSVNELDVGEFIFNQFERQKDKSCKIVNLPFLLIKNKFNNLDEYHLNYILRKLVNLGLLLDNTFHNINRGMPPYDFTHSGDFDFRSYTYEPSRIYENFRNYIISYKTTL